MPASLISFSLGTMPPIWSSVFILLSLAAIFAGSWVMFWVLSTRSTTQRYWVALGQWGRERRIRPRRCDGESPPAPLDQITIQRVQARVCLMGAQTMLLQFQSFSPIGAPTVGEPQIREGLWNVLIREIETSWPPTGLRPAAADASVVDLFSLTCFPLLGSAERFVIFGSASKAAAAITRSSARGLLPPDVGMLLHGRRLMLDFSDRPFDTVEFERMMAVAEQIVGHLPSPGSAE